MPMSKAISGSILIRWSPIHEIENYYKENQSNFILNGSLMKGVFIKIL